MTTGQIFPGGGSGGGGMDQETADNRYVNVAGDTLEGPLTIATDGIVAPDGNALNLRPGPGGGWLSVNGMSITSVGDPASPDHATNKQYVDDKVSAGGGGGGASITYATVPPASPSTGDVWIEKSA